jgi:hypothetical protein
MCPFIVTYTGCSTTAYRTSWWGPFFSPRPRVYFWKPRSFNWRIPWVRRPEREIYSLPLYVSRLREPRTLSPFCETSLFESRVHISSTTDIIPKLLQTGRTQYSVRLQTERPCFDPWQRRKDFSCSLCVQTGSGAHLSCTVGTGVLSRGLKRGRGVTLTTHPHLAVPWLRQLVAGLSLSHSGQSRWDLWWTKWYWDRFFLEFFGFPLSIQFHRISPF